MVIMEKNKNPHRMRGKTNLGVT